MFPLRTLLYAGYSEKLNNNIPHIKTILYYIVCLKSVNFKYLVVKHFNFSNLVRNLLHTHLCNIYIVHFKLNIIFHFE